MKPVTVALIGAGRIAEAHAQAVESIPDAWLVAVVDPVREAAERVASHHGAEALLDHRDLEGCDLAIVCTPPSTHEAITLDLLKSGVDVLCEKPLALSVDAARRMFEVADEFGRTLTMASKFRFVSDIEQAKQLISEGEIGTIRLADISFRSRVEMTGRWNADPVVSGGGVLADNGPHAVDVLRYVVGPIRSGWAVEASRSQDLSVEDTLVGVVGFEGGARGVITLSWSLAATGGDYLRVQGDEGEIVVGWQGSSIRRRDDDWRPFGTGYDKQAAFQAVLEDTLLARNGSPSRVTREEAIASVAVVSGLYESLQSSHEVGVDLRVVV